MEEANAQLKAFKAEAQTRLKELEARIATEARALLKQRFNYPVFLYEAEKVGLTATGEADDNELYPNPRVPAGIEEDGGRTVPPVQGEPRAFFRLSPHAAPLLPGEGLEVRANARDFAVHFSDLDYWVMPKRTIVGDIPDGWEHLRMGDVVTQAGDRIKVEAERSYNMTGVKWYGEGVFPREPVLGKDSAPAT